MAKPVLVVMAAGMGSRYGGLKQIDPVGPNGEIIIDYSVYDAIKAGFGKVVFIIKQDIENLFRKKISKNIEKHIDTQYVFQRLDDLPEGWCVPEGRSKPWGTAHAVMSCRRVVDTPFAVINADDFYGRKTFQVMNDYLEKIKDNNSYNYCMVGFVLENTLTEHGTVARGICKVDNNGYLKNVQEITKIKKFGKTAKYTENGENWEILPSESTVSLNTWGFTPGFFKELEQGFVKFLSSNKNNLSKVEYFLPEVVGNLIEENRARVKVLPSKEKWYGVTYKDDKPLVVNAVNDLVKQGIYPEKLWGNSK